MRHYSLPISREEAVARLRATLYIHAWSRAMDRASRRFDRAHGTPHPSPVWRLYGEAVDLAERLERHFTAEDLRREGRPAIAGAGCREPFPEGGSR